MDLEITTWRLYSVIAASTLSLSLSFSLSTPGENGFPGENFGRDT